MVKRLQNKWAGSRVALPTVSAYALLVWLVCGLVQQGWWLQIGFFSLSVILMVLLNNINALIRIYSRMVSCSYIMLMCCACFLFPSLRGIVMETCLIGALLILFNTYQDKDAPGTTYYAYVLFGCCTLAFPLFVWFVPLLWVLSATQLQTTSWRNWGASVLGLLTPYWIGLCWVAWKEDFGILTNHLVKMVEFNVTLHFANALNYSQLLVLALLAVLAVVGVIHYLRKHHDDKIRIRLLYGFFIWLLVAATLALLLMPQHYDAFVRIIIVCTAPLAGHFLALTNTKVTNIAFFVILTITVLITAYNAWMLLSLS